RCSFHTISRSFPFRRVAARRGSATSDTPHRHAAGVLQSPNVSHPPKPISTRPRTLQGLRGEPLRARPNPVLPSKRDPYIPANVDLETRQSRQAGRSRPVRELSQLQAEADLLRPGFPG